MCVTIMEGSDINNSEKRVSNI